MGWSCSQCVRVCASRSDFVRVSRLTHTALASFEPVFIHHLFIFLTALATSITVNPVFFLGVARAAIGRPARYPRLARDRPKYMDSSTQLTASDPMRTGPLRDVDAVPRVGCARLVGALAAATLPRWAVEAAAGPVRAQARGAGGPGVR